MGGGGSETARQLLERARVEAGTGRYAAALALLDRAEAADTGAHLAIAIARVDPLRLTGRLEDATTLARATLDAAQRAEHAALLGPAAVALGLCRVQAGDYAAAAALAERARVAAAAAGDEPTGVLARHLQAFSLVAFGHVAEADAAYEEGVALARRAGPARELARILASHAQLRLDMADLEGGGRRAEEALRVASEAGSPPARVKALQVVAVWLVRVGRPEEAMARLVEAEATARALGDPQGQALAWNAMAEIHRAAGALDEAARGYARALELGERAGSNTTIFRLNLAAVASERGDWATAAATAERLAERAQGPFGALAALTTLAAYTALGQVEDANRWEPRAARQVEEMALAEPDIARLLERAAEHGAGHAGEPTLTLAARCLGIALRMWAAIDDAGAQARVGEALRQLARRGARIPLGPYDLVRHLGSGGMGAVWEALHREEGLPVAVKVLTTEAARAEATVAMLRAEVRAVARLNHRNIVQIFDHGRVDAVAEAMSGGRLVAGSPTLTMELGAGSLTPSCGRLPWAETRAVLLDLLDALAHAHARGLVHRDLKPDNVLFGPPPRAEIKLTDFGLAHAIGEADHRVAGTPSYMAPELARGDARAIGPWTDLYALGCLGWALVAGAPPFGTQDPLRVLERQVREDPPPLQPAVAVPVGLEAWLRRLLAKSPGARFQRAADARAALCALGEPTLQPAQENPWSWQAASTLDLSRNSGATFFVDLPRAPPEPTPPPPAPEPAGPAPVPPDWRGAEEEDAQVALRGAGLRTFGLREVPLVDREAERDALWSALRAGAPRAVLLRGPAGVGKTRLASWLAVRAHETGAGTPLTLSGEGPGPGLRRLFRWEGLAGEGLRAAVAGALGLVDEDEIGAVVELVSEDGPGAAHRGPAERAAVLALVLRRLCSERAVVLTVDEGHRELASVDLLTRLISAPDPLPLVGLVCAREDLLALEPEAARLVDALAALPQTLSLSVGPLQDEAVDALLRHMLRLDLTLAGQVARRAAGNPLFALELVGDWVERGALIPGEDGYRLREGREGREAPLPEDVREVWDLRVEGALGGLPAGSAVALELGAVLGLVFEDEDWRALCLRAGSARSAALEERLQERRLLEREGALWRFCHGMLRETLLRRAEEAGRLAGAHLAAAEVLLARGADPSRLGRHLLGAGRSAEAVDPLLAAARAAYDRAAFPDALALLDAGDDAMDRAALPPEDARRVDAALQRASVLQVLGRFDESLAVASRAEQVARLAGDRRQLANALRQQALVLRVRGRLQEALEALEEVERLLVGCDDLLALAKARHGLALVRRSLGDPAGARETMAEALALGERTGDARFVTSTRFALGAIDLQLGRLVDASAHLQAAIAGASALGERSEMAVALNGLAELDRKLGRLDAAEARYLQALRLFRLTGLGMAIYPRLNLALVQLARGRWEEARAGLLPVLAEVRRQGREGLTGAVHVMLGAPEMALGHLSAFDEHLEEGRRLLERTGFAEPDTAWCAELASRVAAARGDEARAAVARRVAELQRRAAT